MGKKIKIEKFEKDGIIFKRCVGPCQEILEECENIFKIRKDTKKFANQCRNCSAIYNKKYYKNNFDIISEKTKIYQKNNKESIKEYKNKYAQENKEYISEYKKNYYEANKEDINAKNRKNYANNKEERSRLSKIFRSKNKEKISESKRKYYQDNKPKIIAKQNEKERKRRKTDISFKLRKNISRRVNEMLKTFNKTKNNQSILSHLGYSMEDLKAHIENQFEPWMNWSNQGIYKLNEWDDNTSSTWRWHLDHIVPQSDLPYDSMEHPNFKKCWALENLRPLSAKQNVIEGVRKIRHIKKIT